MRVSFASAIRGDLPVSLQVRGSNYCDLGWRVDERTGRLIVISVIDNLTRGAAGQAVCNMNIMCGLPEDAGLKRRPGNRKEEKARAGGRGERMTFVPDACICMA